MESLNEHSFEDMKPAELVRNAKLSMQSMVFRPQAERDRIALGLHALCEQQCYAALELGDEKAFVSYSRASRFVAKYIRRYLYGETFGVVDHRE